MRAGTIVIGAEVFSSILRVISTAFLARLLMPADFGLLSMVTSISVFAERFKDLGLADATVQSMEVTHSQTSGLFWINFFVCCVIAVALSALSKLIAMFYGEPRLVGITMAIASTFLFSGLVIQHQALLRRQLRFGAVATITLGSVTGSLAVGIVLAYFGFGYWSLVARELSRAIFVFVGTWIACPWRPGPPQRKVGISSLLLFGRNVTAFNIVNFLSRSVDRILIGRLSGAYWVGLYDNALKSLRLPVEQIRYPISTVALPALSALQAQPDRFKAYYEKASQLLAFVAAPIIVFAFVFADLMIGLLLGPKWTAAVPIFRILAIGAFIDPLTQLVGPALVAYGKTKQYFILGLTGSLLFVAFLLVGGILWGTIGVSIASSAAAVVSAVIIIVYGFKYIPVVGKDILPKLLVDLSIAVSWGTLLAAVRYAVGWFLQPSWILAFAAGGMFLYFALWWVIPGGRQRLSVYRDYLLRIFTRAR